MTGMMDRGRGNCAHVRFFDRVQGEVRDLSVWKARGSLEDKEDGESVCTSLGQDPEGVMGWECLERLQREREREAGTERLCLFLQM